MTGRTRAYAWQVPGDRVTRKKAQNASYLCCYAAISIHGVSPLIVVGESHKRVVVPNSDQFQAALDQLIEWEKGLPRDRRLKTPYKWVMDNAKAHTSSSTKQYMEQHQVVRIEDWPPQSPDLNLIENAWSKLRSELNKVVQPKSFELWKAAVHRAWSQIPQSMIDNMYEDWDRRLQQVVSLKGAGPVA